MYGKNAFLSSKCVGGFLLMIWRNGRGDFKGALKKVLKNVQGLYWGRPSAKFEGTPKSTVTKINVILMEIF